MSLQLENINLGEYANDGTGDDLRTAFAKVKFNFDVIDTNFPIKLSEDENPRLGGDLDLNGHNLYSNAPITITTDNLIVTGPISGQIDYIGNHKLGALQDVFIPEEVVDRQALVWNSETNQWTPGSVDANVTGVDGGGAATIFNPDEGAVIDGGYAE
jgi:hypothetical protein